jgi:hypothetical protein
MIASGKRAMLDDTNLPEFEAAEYAIKSALESKHTGDTPTTVPGHSAARI